MKLNLGCGEKTKKGYVNLDIRKLPNVDVIHDLNKFPYPFDDDSFDEIYMSHVLEHLEDPKRVMSELWRISKDKGKIKIICPYFSHVSAYMWGHKNFLRYESFNRIGKISVFGNSKFRVLDKKIFLSQSKGFLKSGKSWLIDFLINKFPYFYERWLCWIFPAKEIHFLLEVEKWKN